jgi:hypothetical protein
VLRRWRDALARNPLFGANRARRPVGTVPWPGGAPPRVPARRPDGGVPPPGPVHALDYPGRVDVSYTPTPDGHPDPGEVVWTWVPYEDDPTVGKDRPVVVLGRALDLPGHELATVMLSSREHPDDPRWLLVGPGGWDSEGRVSSVRVDRVLSVAPEAVRREGSALDRPRFDRVAAAVTVARRRR